MNEIKHENGRFLRSFKSLLGHISFDAGTAVYGKKTPYVNIIAVFMARLKLLIDTYAKEDVTSVVFGRPVHFVDNNNEDDKKAEETLVAIANVVGFKNVSFQYEPVAAAFAHKQILNLTKPKNTIVIDIGGGTSDFSVLTLKPNNSVDILSNSGIHIGGNDFDTNFSFDVVMPMYGKGTKYKSWNENKNLPIPTGYYTDLSKWTTVNDFHDLSNAKESDFKEIVKSACEPDKVKYLKEIFDKKLGFVNLSTIEQTKIKLSGVHETFVDFDFFEEPIQHHCFKRLDFEKSVQVNIDKICATIQKSIDIAKLKNDDIDIVIFTGGSTKIPLIQQKVNNMFKKAEFIDTDVMTSVCSGLAYYAKENSGDFKYKEPLVKIIQ